VWICLIDQDLRRGRVNHVEAYSVARVKKHKRVDKATSLNKVRVSAELVKRRSKVLATNESKRRKQIIKQHTQEEGRQPTRTLRMRNPNNRMLGDQAKEIRQQAGTGKVLTRRSALKSLKIVH